MIASSTETGVDVIESGFPRQIGGGGEAAISL